MDHNRPVSSDCPLVVIDARARFAARQRKTTIYRWIDDIASGIVLTFGAILIPFLFIATIGQQYVWRNVARSFAGAVPSPRIPMEPLFRPPPATLPDRKKRRQKIDQPGHDPRKRSDSGTWLCA